MLASCYPLCFLFSFSLPPKIFLHNGWCEVLFGIFEDEGKLLQLQQKQKREEKIKREYSWKNRNIFDDMLYDVCDYRSIGIENISLKLFIVQVLRAKKQNVAT